MQSEGSTNDRVKKFLTNVTLALTTDVQTFVLFCHIYNFLADRSIWCHMVTGIGTVLLFWLLLFWLAGIRVSSSLAFSAVFFLQDVEWQI